MASCGHCCSICYTWSSFLSGSIDLTNEKVSARMSLAITKQETHFCSRWADLAVDVLSRTLQHTPRSQVCMNYTNQNNCINFLPQRQRFWAMMEVCSWKFSSRWWCTLRLRTCLYGSDPSVHTVFWWQPLLETPQIPFDWSWMQGAWNSRSI